MTDQASTQPGLRRSPALAVLLALLLGLVLVGCSGEHPPAADSRPPTAVTFGGSEVSAGTTAPTGPSGIGEGWAPAVRGRTPLRGFSEVAATVTAGDGTTCEVCLLAATTGEQRARGLMEVTDPDLGGYDGMLFAYEQPVDGGFWMRNTPMPLSIAYFDADKVLVSATDMAPCDDSPSCRQYLPEGPFQYALEVPAGRLDDVAVTGRATFEVTGGRCPVRPKG